jgi:hypothetical protein
MFFIKYEKEIKRVASCHPTFKRFLFKRLILLSEMLSGESFRVSKSAEVHAFKKSLHFGKISKLNKSATIPACSCGRFSQNLASAFRPK